MVATDLARNHERSRFCRCGARSQQSYQICTCETVSYLSRELRIVHGTYACMRVLTESKGYCGVSYQLSSTTDTLNYHSGLVRLTAIRVEHRLAELAAISVRYRFIHFFLSLSRKLSRKRDRAVNVGGHASFSGILSGSGQSSLCWLKTKSGPQGSNGLLISWSGSMGALGISELQVVCRNWHVTKYKRLSELPLELLRPAVDVSK